MLYLEDYLEMIEHLPQELRDRFTEIREMDLSVQNNMDTLDQRLRNLFNGCRRGEINSDQAQVEFSDINRNFDKTGEEAEEKVAMATQMYDLVNRYIKKLDSELHKFKCELEADNKGITEILEKRSLDLDTNSIINNNNSSSSYKENRYRVRTERHRPHLWGSSRDSRGHTTVANVNSSRNAESAIQAALSRDPYALNNSAANGIVLAAAATAVTATQQLSQGRRTASLKATYEALAGADQHVVQAAHHDHGHGIGTSHGHGNSIHGHHTTVHGHTATATSNKRHKQKKSTYATSGLSSQQSLASTAASRSNSPNLMDTSAVQNNVTIEEPVEEEWTYDPNEPRYCICNQVSYGDMVACDNQDCPYEWFHYPCVGITAPPKGKWYCPQCQVVIRKNRTHRKN